MENLNKVHSIHALRGIAAILVVIHHVCQYLVTRGRSTAGLGEFPTGAFGVDLFFVISGFVIVIATPKETGWVAIGNFLRRRAERVLPMYWVATCVLGFAFFILPNAFTTFHVSFMDFAKSILFIPIHNEHGQLRPLLSQGWTLFYELFFYLTFATTLFVRYEIRLYFLVSTISIGYAVGLLLLPPSVEWIINSPLLFEFISGAVLAIYIKKKGLGAIRNSTAYVLLLASILALIYVTPPVSVGWERVLTWGLPAFGIILSACKLESSISLSSKPTFAFLGDASYSIYLLHGLGLTLAGKLLPNIFVDLPLLNILYLCASGILVGSLGHIFIEKRINAFLKKLRTPKAT